METRVVKAEVKPVTKEDISEEFDPGMRVLILELGETIEWPGE